MVIGIRAVTSNMNQVEVLATLPTAVGFIAFYRLKNHLPIDDRWRAFYTP